MRMSSTGSDGSSGVTSTDPKSGNRGRRLLANATWASPWVVVVAGVADMLGHPGLMAVIGGAAGSVVAHSWYPRASPRPRAWVVCQRVLLVAEAIGLVVLIAFAGSGWRWAAVCAAATRPPTAHPSSDTTVA